MTLNDIKLDVFRRLNYSDTPPTAVVNRIVTFIQERHRIILSAPGISRLRDGNLTFASVSNQATYALPQAFSRIKAIYDGTTNQMKLTERTVEWLRSVDPRLSASGTPEAWIPLSITYVSAQPASTGSGLWVKSSAGGDTTQTAYVEVVRLGGYRWSGSVTLNGTSTAQIGSFTDIVQVDKFYLSATAVGTVTLLDAASLGNTLGTIAIGQTMPRNLYIQLWPTPSSVWTYNVDYTREIFDLTNANDEPLWSPDFHYLLSVGARMDEYEKTNDPRFSLVEKQWNQGLSRLREYVTNTSEYLFVPGGTPKLNDSNLGSWFPAGSRW